MKHIYFFACMAIALHATSSDTEPLKAPPPSPEETACTSSAASPTAHEMPSRPSSPDEETKEPNELRDIIKQALTEHLAALLATKEAS